MFQLKTITCFELCFMLFMIAGPHFLSSWSLLCKTFVTSQYPFWGSFVEPLSHSHPGCPSFSSSPFPWLELTPGGGGCTNASLNREHSRAPYSPYSPSNMAIRTLTPILNVSHRGRPSSFFSFPKVALLGLNIKRNSRVKQNECNKGVIRVLFEVLSSLPQFWWTKAFIPSATPTQTVSEAAFQYLFIPPVFESEYWKV